MSDKKKDDRSKKRKDDKQKIRTFRELKRLVNRNNASDKSWFHGLDGKWWWGMSEDDAMKRAEQGLVQEIDIDRIILVSTWNINCGIATYTKYLLDEFNKVDPNSFVVNPINEGVLKHKIKEGLVHIQHEFGIIPTIPKIKNRLIVTWHTVSVSKNMIETVKRVESDSNIVAHIVHSECARQDINTSKDVWTIPHGSTLIPKMTKEDARRLLGIDINMPIGFVFGFHHGDDNYERLIGAAKNTGIHLMISGAPRHLETPAYLKNDKNVTFINRFLTEDEVNLYALAGDMLLFDYMAKDYYSVSGAMHRIIGAGRPVVCSDIRHFSDVIHNYNCLKFKDQPKLEKCIRRALKDSERLGLAAREYAEKTSWEKIAKRHIEIYNKYTDINSLKSAKLR